MSATVTAPAHLPTAPAGALSIRRRGVFLGAEVTGIDLTRPLDEPTVAALSRAHAEHGVLVLSEFTGAARELDHAVHVNPFAVDAFADGLHTALSMSAEEQRRRMRALRERVSSHTVFDWASALLLAASRRMESVA